MLQVRDLTVHYGGALALRDVHVEVPEGRCVAVLGRNGAGKTTLLRAISGLVAPSAGEVRWNGRRLGPHPARLAAAGLRFVPESGNTFPDLTVAENLRTGAPWLTPAVLRERVEQVLAELPILRRLWDRRAGLLSGGERQALAVGRALVGRPSLLLVDEPSLGLAPAMATEMLRVLRRVTKRDGVTVLLAEQKVELATEVADHVVYLDAGRIGDRQTIDGP
ncbi:MAG TPA: ABC transporter ATP-binding protein [Micromonosporaceae bacterium]